MDNPSLAKFREDWRAELGLTTNDNVNKAIDSWLEAQEHERNGEMGRAIAMYRKAEKLDPGVYTHMRDVPVEYQKQKQKEYRVMELQPDEVDLADDFNELRIDQVKIDCSRATIQKSWTTSKPHIGDLPNEMLYQIAQALVGPNLSYKALSWLSMTCKAWYGVVNDDELWRKGCEQLWEKEALVHLIEKHHSYRQVFIKTPRPNISEGLYVAHQSYWREGAGYVTRGGWGVEQQHVNYRRYIRFLPGKRLFIYCSPDRPRQVLQKVMGHDFVKLGGLIGTWSFTDDNMHLCAIVERIPERVDKIDKFIIVWRMQKRGKRLVWVEYSYEGHNIERNLVQSSTYDVREFPPLQLHKIPKNFQL